MKKRTAVLFGLTFLLSTTLLLTACRGRNTFSKDFFDIVTEDGVVIRPEMTGAELASRGFSISVDGVTQLDNVQIQLKDDRITEISLHRDGTIKMAGNLTFELTRDELIEMFHFDEKTEYFDRDKDYIDHYLLFFRKNNKNEYERIIVLQDEMEQFYENHPDDIVVLVIELREGQMAVIYIFPAMVE